MFAAMLIHGGIIGFVILVLVCLAFGDDKAKKEATKASQDVAGCGCCIVIIILVAVAFCIR